jgi:hypothetical protein
MQRRTRKVVIWLFGVASLLSSACAVYLSLNPDNYFFYRAEDRASWVYQPSSVFFVCLIMLAEAIVACVAIVASRPNALWLRCFLGFLLLAPWAFFSTMLVVHMPFYTLFHHGWVWLLVLVLALTAFGSAIRQFYLRFVRKETPTNSFKQNPLHRSA